MRKKLYYSVRTGKNPLSEKIDLKTLRDLFKTIFVHFENEGYFQQDLGYECVDAGFVPGTLGHDIAGALLLELRKRDLTPGASGASRICGIYTGESPLICLPPASCRVCLHYSFPNSKAQTA